MAFPLVAGPLIKKLLYIYLIHVYINTKAKLLIITITRVKHELMNMNNNLFFKL